jgi:hypothetical protein
MEESNVTEVRNAKWVSGIPAGSTGEDGTHYAVGRNFPFHDKNAPIIDMITVSPDLPGIHCNMERVRVWAADGILLWEGPLHNLEGVGYA